MKKLISLNKIFTIVVIVQGLFLLLLIWQACQPIEEINISIETMQNASNNEYVEYGVDAAGNEYVSIVNDSEESISLDQIINVDVGGISSGAYKVQISYSIVNDYDAEGIEQELNTKDIYFTSAENTSAVRGETIVLNDAKEYMESSLLIATASRMRDLSVQLDYEGIGEIIIYEINLVEQPIYRLVCFLGFLILFLVIDFIYLFFFVNGLGNVRIRIEKYKAYIILSVIFALSMLPYITDFLPYGHDLSFHLSRIGTVATELSYGQFPVRIGTDMLGGYGYVNSLFYCDLFLYIPALLYLCMVPLQTCYVIYVGVINLMTIGISYYCFKKITNDQNIAIVGTVLYMFASYRMCNILVRAAVGEYSAMAFLPLVILGMWEIYRKEELTYRDWLPLSLGMSGIIMSHIISTEITIMFLLVFCIFMIKKTIKPKRILCLVKASLVTFSLCAWFIVPFLQSMTMDVKTNVTELSAIQSEGTYVVQLLSMFMMGGGYSVSYMQDEMPLNLGWMIIFGVVLSIYCWIRKEEWGIEGNRIFQMLQIATALGIVATVFSLKLFPWDTIGRLGGEVVYKFITVIQFPWRFLGVATALFIVATICALLILKEKKYGRYKQSIIVLLILTIIINGSFLAFFADENSVVTAYSMTDSRFNTIAGGEYILVDAIDNDRTQTVPVSQGEYLEVISYDKIQGTYEVSVDNTGGEEVLTMPIYVYDNYVAKVSDTNAELEIADMDNGLINIVIPSNYKGLIEIEYSVPMLWRICELISLLTFLILSIGLVRNGIRRKRNYH